MNESSLNISYDIAKVNWLKYQVKFACCIIITVHDQLGKVDSAGSFGLPKWLVNRTGHHTFVYISNFWPKLLNPNDYFTQPVLYPTDNGLYITVKCHFKSADYTWTWLGFI